MGISKRGDRILRKMLIHGARTVLNWCGPKTDKLSLWLKALSSRAHPYQSLRLDSGHQDLVGAEAVGFLNLIRARRIKRTPLRSRIYV
jgi:transposase